MNIIPILVKPGVTPSTSMKEAAEVSDPSLAECIYLECESIKIAFNSEHKYTKLPQQMAIVIDLNKKFRTVTLNNIILGSLGEEATVRRRKALEYAFVEWNFYAGSGMKLVFLDQDTGTFVDYLDPYIYNLSDFDYMDCKIRSGIYSILKNNNVIVQSLVLEEI